MMTSYYRFKREASHDYISGCYELVSDAYAKLTEDLLMANRLYNYEPRRIYTGEELLPMIENLIVKERKEHEQKLIG